MQRCFGKLLPTCGVACAWAWVYFIEEGWHGAKKRTEGHSRYSKDVQEIELKALKEIERIRNMDKNWKF